MDTTLETLTFTATSIAPLLMHSTRGMMDSDPKVKELRALTKKHPSKKSDEDKIEIQRLEFVLGMYHNGDGKTGRPVLPTDMILAAVRDGGKANRMGKEIDRSVFVQSDEILLEYEGPKTIEGLWANKKFVDARTVKVGQSRILRTRPKFDNWSFTTTLTFDSEHLDRDQLVRAVETAGARAGIGDYRPRYGRFDVTFS